MGRLNTIKPRVDQLNKSIRTIGKNDNRITGRKLQTIRFNMWRNNPHCECCGRLTAHPYGYEIDHVQPLYKGGHDVPENRQLLCTDYGEEPGCHTLKTREDMACNGDRDWETGQ